MNKGIIYKVTNLENDMIYIGMTKGSLEGRKKRHMDYAKHLWGYRHGIYR